MSKQELINSNNKRKITVQNIIETIVKNVQTRIREMSTENQKAYWKLLNSIDEKHDQITIKIKTAFDYFKMLNS